MSHIYWEKKEVPIPPDAYINHNDGRVFVMVEGKRKVIGHATSENTMHPNDMFRALYPDLWEAAYGEKDALPFELHAGLYALTLGVSYKTGIYPILTDIYGTMYTNAILDYAMFSISCKSDVTQQFQETMKDRALFSRKLYSDSWYSDFFKNQMLGQQISDFKVQWMKHCQEMGVTKAWIAIDGTNNGCEVQQSELCEYGSPKSHNDCTIVSYIYAVDTKTGMPITYFVNEGSKVDCQAFQKVAAYFAGYHIDIEGVLIDRGFCTHDVITACIDAHLDYIMMLPSDNYGHQQIMAECSEKIRWEPEKIVDDDGVFGITQKEQLFQNYDETAYLNLYYDGTSGPIQSIRLIRQIREEGRKAEKKAAAGIEPHISKGLDKYIRVQQDDKGWHVVYDYDAWKGAMNRKGFFSLASGLNHGAQESFDLYRLRDASEVQYGILKSQEGFDTTRVHFTSSIYSKFQVCFITSCIRASVMDTCRKLHLPTNEVIQKMDRIHFILVEGGTYLAVKSVPEDCEKLLEAYDLDRDSFAEIADDYNKSISSPVYSQVRSMPKHEQKTKSRRGRKPGSKNRKTSERKADGETQPHHGKAGRPRGSKDKKPRKPRSDKGKKRKKPDNTVQ